jgi:hypothetical protein
MEYLIGALITIVAYIVTNKLARSTKEERLLKIEYSQSHIYELMRPFIEMVGPMEENTPKQSENYIKNIYMRIIIVKNKAYWIKDNMFYVANVVDGEVEKQSAQEVDTMSMSKVELEEIMFIVEKLREDDNDSRSSR